MKLIGADALLEVLEREEAYNKDIPQRADGIRDAIMDVISASAIDAVPVVRCKNCYYKTFKPNTCMLFCKYHKIYIKAEEFCSYGVMNEVD